MKSKDYPDERNCDCYFIRKKNWMQLVNDFSEDETLVKVVDEFKKYSINNFKNKIFDPA